MIWGDLKRLLRKNIEIKRTALKNNNLFNLIIHPNHGSDN